ncbi:putative sigma-54 modulation protein [Anaerotignum neopropionicum]|uniref:Ribosome hibernation promoting factor n=1 Tax=Anaerotignum neopropionicum TaxID=36847 RepID=A0A136WIR5_9FIRM|nr:ribosome-associated translation inhibitor RaiA [Anaerotignum neopropionicum]KXL54432.1 putative sigma-54 modulation protein [Anaerotignum neopropionicum]
MLYNIIGKNIDVWDKTKEAVEHKMDRIHKLFPEDAVATITLSLEKLVSTVEVTIPMNKRIIRAEVSDYDMIAALDKAVDILDGQIVRYKKRMRTKVRQNAENYMAEYQTILVPEAELDEEPLYKIERVKHFEVKPMDAEEAVMEMEMIGHNFFVFRNGETDALNVVYKRKNGSYGVIEPEY